MNVLRCLVVMALCGFMSNQALAATTSGSQPSVPVTCLELIHNYVKKTRGWERSSYVVEDENFGGDGLGFSVWLLSELSVLRPPGGGESFHVDVDKKCLRVNRELAYQ